MARKRSKAERAEAARLGWLKRRKHTRGRKQRVVDVAALPRVDNTELMTVPGYELLRSELLAAYEQSTNGKGKERHANGRAFHNQPIIMLGRMYGPGFAAGQAAKKAQEALGMLARGEADKAIHELHGAIVYLAATAALIREG